MNDMPFAQVENIKGLVRLGTYARNEGISKNAAVHRVLTGKLPAVVIDGLYFVRPEPRP